MRGLQFLYNQMIHQSKMSAENIQQHAMGAPFFHIEHDQKYQNDWIRVNYQNYLYINEAKLLTGLFEQRALNYSWLKGVYLVREIYPKNFARPMSDLDLFLLKSEEEAWHELLCSQGYLRRESQSSLSLNKIEYIKILSGQQVCLEVHTSLYYEEHHMISRDEDCPKSLEEHFVYLVYHYMRQHSGARLVWLLDLITIAELKIVNWKRVEELIERRGLGFAYQLIAMNTDGIIPLNSNYSRPLIRLNLLKTHTRSWRYYLLKHIVKGFRGSLNYNFRWVKEKVANKFLRSA